MGRSSSGGQAALEAQEGQRQPPTRLSSWKNICPSIQPTCPFIHPSTMAARPLPPKAAAHQTIHLPTLAVASSCPSSSSSSSSAACRRAASSAAISRSHLRDVLGLGGHRIRLGGEWREEALVAAGHGGLRHLVPTWAERAKAFSSSSPPAKEDSWPDRPASSLGCQQVIGQRFKHWFHTGVQAVGICQAPAAQGGGRVRQAVMNEGQLTGRTADREGGRSPAGGVH